ncbi:tail fiber domain-containing protein [Bradyrhizobium sp.]|jgi:hypothetical protein|uniref:tail fiber domain-containing protein n=1 Tax=Bradyrhizobium sp. TaxID=376 RepID=UPI002DDCD2DC|nr:tail fiber domain-containing protein [Bradyrhizobium sp.]HEV2160245.1 tail fiber domain-containing protein [Bradyrhizobium sp.]
MDTPSAPAAPDPVATAKAQGDMNQNTATTQQLLNMTNQVTPDGSLTYNQTGNNTFTGADGKSYTVPQFTATQTLSPTQQLLKSLSDQTKQNIGQIGVDQSAKIGSLLGTNVNLSNDAVESRLMDLGTKRLQPQFDRDEEALRTRLANSGIRAGSDAWNAEMQRLGQTKNDALDQLLLNGRQQSVNEIMAERNQPINEISALLSGSQVSQPNFTSTPQTNVAGVDYTGLVNNNYNVANQQYQTQVGQQNALMGGLFGLAGTAGGMGIYKYSDRRLKSDVKHIGDGPHGLPVYEYTIFGKRERGVMADEVARVMPAAVIERDGLKMVDYAMLGLA